VRPRLKTRQRLTLLAVAMLTAGVAISAGLVYASLSATVDADADESLVAEAGQLAPTLIDEGGRVISTEGALPRETPSGAAVAVAVMGPTGPMLDSSLQPLDPSILAQVYRQVLRHQAPVWITVTAGGVSQRVYAEPLPQLGPGMVLILSRSLQETQTDLAQALLLLILLGAVVIAGGGLLVYWVTGRALRPVRTIARVARTLGEQDLHRRVEIRVPEDEMGQLVDTFNGMLARLEAAFEALKRFTADASHELRAPLMLMQTEIDVALSRGRQAAEYERTLRSVREEVAHVTRLSEHLLMLARADAGQLRPEPEAVDVADLVHETAARWQAAAARFQVEIEVSAPDQGTVLADASLVRRILDNLLDNAIRHSPTGGRVALRAETAGGEWVIRVSDQGPGIPRDQATAIFHRFTRLDRARSPGHGGAGLGLALSLAIARAHGGDLRLVTDGGSGAVFELRLPGPGAEAGGPLSRTDGCSETEADRA
jgi:two-component system OmpR family sensor kinase